MDRKQIKVNDLNMYKFTNTTAEKPQFNQTARDFLKEKYKGGFNFGLENLKQIGVYKLLGWEIDFKPIMKRFIIKQHNILREEYAFNKTDLRNSTFGRIQYIKEI